MDSSIRVLLQLCQEENNRDSLAEPYEKLKAESGRNDKPSIGLDLYVICAEVALKFREFEIAEDCISMYFQHSPPANQYLCRAYMCQARVHAPVSAKNPIQIGKAVDYLLKAVNFAKQNPRYHFLVYNSSVLYWQFCRPFLKPNCKRFLAKTLHHIVKALDDIDDRDYEWRAQLMITLVECHVDAGRKDDASQTANIAAQFTKKNMPNLYKNVLSLQVQHKLVDYSKLAKELKTSPDLHLFFKIHRLKAQLESDEKTDVGQDLVKFFKGLTGLSDKSGTSTEASDKSSSGTLVRTATPVSMETDDRMKLILELAKICMNHGFHKITNDCLDYVEKNAKDPGTNLEAKFMECLFMVKSLGNKQESYTQTVVQVRLKAINKLEKAFMTSLRYGDPQVIQVGCMAMWNLCLPLLQPNLRHHVRKPLIAIADALESIESLLTLLRCQIHTELAKCEENEEQLELAMTHLRKALQLDDEGLYHDRLNTSLTRLKLRATMYTTPERAEDLAAMIIEQARTSNDSGTSKMKRASLVKAGVALAPDAFAIVLESESEPSTEKGPPSLLAKISNKAKHYEKCIGKAAGHLRRLGTTNDQERVRIWADLARTARKQQIWDVARVAARFCLLYDDGRWSVVKGKQSPDDEGEYGKSEERRSSSGTARKKAENANKKISTASYEEERASIERDLVRTLAEIYLINSEALVQFLKSQDILLCNKAVPSMFNLGDKNLGKTPIEDTPEWTTYRDWISSISQASIQGFQRAAFLGTELQESWLVCNSIVYLLNYTAHVVAERRHRELVSILTPVLQNLKLVGYFGEATLLCQLTNVLASGLMQPWYPMNKSSMSTTSPMKNKKDKGGSKPAPKLTSSGLEPDAVSELKQALEHLEFALQVTNGNEARNLVSISVRHSIITLWVHCKQLLSQQIPKNLGHDTDSPESQGPMSRCLCAVEMLSVHHVGLSEFAWTPSVSEVVRMVGSCVWSDNIVALEMWSRLAILANKNENHELVMECGNKAMNFADKDINKKKSKKNAGAVKHKEKTKQQLLHYASAAMGQSLVRNIKGQIEIRRDALVHFVNACRFAQMAKNYVLVMSSARHYWNTILPLIGEPLERQLLLEPLQAVLHCIADVADKNIGKDEEEEEEDEGICEDGKTTKNKTKRVSNDSKKTSASKLAKNASGKSGKGAMKTASKQDGSGERKTEESTSTAVKAVDEDLKIRASLYSVLFQAYADKGQFEQGLQAMDEAVRDMPRTSHRLLIFKHRVITKAKLGKDVQFDMGKFKNENELMLSSMWHHVAINCQNSRGQLSAYQNAIDVLKDRTSNWQKVDYLLQFGEWLFVNGYTVDDATDQFMWAIDILMNRTDDEDYNSDNCETSVNFVTGYLNIVNNVKTLEYLARSYIMLAEFVGQHSPKYRDYCLYAANCVQRIWKVSLEYAEKMTRDAPKTGGECTPTKKKDKTKEQKDVTKDKTGLPTSLQAWGVFQIPDKYVERFNSDQSQRLVNQVSFCRPAVSVHYLTILVDNLCCLGYTHFCLPITSLIGCLAKHVLGNELLLKFAHLRAMEICQDLLLVEGVAFHENAAKWNENDENEIAKSREEIELLREKQHQIQTEKANLLNSTDENDTSLSQKYYSNMDSTTAVNKSWMNNKRIINKIEKREIWTKIAGIYINQGHYQLARRLLNEANTSSLVFEDHRCRAEVLYNLSVLALHESNPQLCVSLLQEVQQFSGDHQFWLKTILLLVDAICERKDRTDTKACLVDNNAKIHAIEIIQQSLNVIRNLDDNAVKKAPLTNYVVAMLEAKLGYITAKDSVTGSQHDRVINLKQSLKYLEKSTLCLCESGYIREAIKVNCQRAIILRQLAVKCEQVEGKRQLYIKAFKVLNEATELSSSLLQRINCHSTFYELCNVSLPVERDCVETRLYLADMTVTIMNEHTKDERLRRNKEARKGSVQKLIDEFIQVEPQISEEQKEWNEITKTITESTLNNLSAAFSQCNQVPYLKAKCCLVLGHCLRTLASHLNPSDTPQWQIYDSFSVATESATKQNENTAVDGTHNEEGDDPGAGEEDQQMLNNAAKKQVEIANTLKSEYKDCLQVVAQAVECLTQTVQLGLKHDFTELVAEASLHLVEIFGRLDPRSSSLYLSLHQSCSMSLCLRDLLERSLMDSSLSRLAALLNQRRLLTKKFHHQEIVSSVLAANSRALAEFEAWRRLAVSKNYLEIPKELSTPNTLHLVLQHSRDKTYLYATTFDKGRGALSSPKSIKQSANTAGSTAKPIIVRSKIEPGKLDELLQRFERFKSNRATELIRQNYLRRQAEEKQKMLATVDNGGLTKEKDILHNDQTVKSKEEKLEQQFMDLTKDIDAYLSPVLEQFKPVLSENNLPETLVVFADEFLLRLPLESSTILCHPQLHCVARDLSLQMHYHRIYSSDQSGTDSRQDGKKGGANAAPKKGGKVDKPLDKPTTATKSQEKGKGDKKTSKDQGSFAKDGLPVDINGLKYIVDPFNECGDTGENSPMRIVDELTTKYRHLSGKWSGVVGKDHAASVGEWQKLLAESSCFIFYGTQKCLDYIPSSLLVSLSLSDCRVMILLDHVETNESFYRQSILDVWKTSSEVEMTSSFESNAVLSLTGVNCAICNQWNCRLVDNKEKLTTIIQACFDENKNIGCALRAYTKYKTADDGTTEPKTQENENVTETSNYMICKQSEAEPQNKEVTLKNTVLYGLPYFILNPVKQQ